MIMEILFWVCLLTVFYAYFGYGLVLFAIIKIKRLFLPIRTIINNEYKPFVSFIVPCYNESEVLEDKILNTLQLDYPKDKIEFIFITDGSDDGSETIVKQYSQLTSLHQIERRGKSAAENRSVNYAKGEIIIFSDANTSLQPDAVNQLIKHYADPFIGGVSGEKRIQQSGVENAAGAGEGFYWKYESKLKKWDAELYTVVGAAGELFSFRKNLYIKMDEDTILDDFMLSLRIASRGYRIQYEPAAMATETASVNSKEELKRKIRICAGGWQAMNRLSFLLNPFNDPLLAFQYISHRVLRWTLAPLFMIVLFAITIPLSLNNSFYNSLLFLQSGFYAAAIAGMIMEKKQIRLKAFFIPYYFCMMNYAAIAGFFRYLGAGQTAVWERSERKIVDKKYDLKPIV
jgi:poly-beta-1,6-N-acetyl-D-glucosamine synthase